MDYAVMSVDFEKYHGAGNDFILIDNREGKINFKEDDVRQLCNRHVGIGADGLIMILNHPELDFEMLYYNADGGIGSMCGNGGRCAMVFASKLGIVKSTARFMAFDGVHNATIISNGMVKLSMANVDEPEMFGDDYILNTGSPHYVTFVDEVQKIDVVAEGRRIRNSDPFAKNGINVNFAAIRSDVIEMRTYERGVEDETLSCGTGTVAVAIAAALKTNSQNQEQAYSLRAPGGNLKVYFSRNLNRFQNVVLEGPVQFVFSGGIKI